MTIPVTSTSRTWIDKIVEADPDFYNDIERRQPVIYEFQNGRKFRDKPNPYSTP